MRSTVRLGGNGHQKMGRCVSRMLCQGKLVAVLAALGVLLAACGDPQNSLGDEDAGVELVAGEISAAPAEHDPIVIAPKERDRLHTSVTGASETDVDLAEEKYGVRLCGPNESVLQPQTPQEVARFDSKKQTILFSFDFLNVSDSICVRPQVENFQLFGADNTMLMSFITHRDCAGDPSCSSVLPGGSFTAELEWDLAVRNATTESSKVAEPGEYTVRLVLNSELLEAPDGTPIQREQDALSEPLSRSVSVESAFTVGEDLG